MRTYFRLGSRLQLNWLRDRIIALPRENRWQALARAALRDDLLGISRTLTQAVMSEAPPDTDSDTAIDGWSEHHAAALQRSLGMIADIKAARIYDTTTLPVALRELRNLVTGDGGGSVAPSARSFSAG
jgi:glutamate dehydrogenase